MWGLPHGAAYFPGVQMPSSDITPVPIPTYRSEMSTERELIGELQRHGTALQITRKSLEGLKERMEQAIRDLATGSRRLDLRLSKVETRCAVEEERMKKIDSLLVKIDDLSTGLSELRGRQEGLLGRVGRPTGWIAVGVAVVELMRAMQGAPLPDSGAIPAPTERIENGR
jgi:predicted RNase H-like nuclease (RuvC/YqgF family)